MAEIDSWPIERRAALVIALPSLNFDVAALSPLLRSGAGAVLFLGGAPAPADLRDRISTAASGLDRATAPLVMADVEGGRVQRLRGVVAPFPWPRRLAATSSASSVQGVANTVGKQMLASGVNVDLAPVLDLDDRPGPSAANPDGLRSFSRDPHVTSRYGIAFMQGLRAAGVLPVLKHFPGIGESSGNTDYGPAATQPYGVLLAAGLRPFADAIAAGAPAVMVSNASTPGLSTEPASVSPAVIEDVLRRKLHFTGLVMTDSLSAGAIADAGYSVPQAAAAAIKAGADLVLFGSTLTPRETALLSPTKVAQTRQAMIDAIAGAVRSGDLPPERLDDALAHVLAAKGVDLCAP